MLDADVFLIRFSVLSRHIVEYNLWILLVVMQEHKATCHEPFCYSPTPLSLINPWTGPVMSAAATNGHHVTLPVRHYHEPSPRDFIDPKPKSTSRP